MASTEIRDRRRVLRYRRPGDQADGADEEPGIGAADGDRSGATTSAGFTRWATSQDLLSTNKEVNQSIRPLLKLSRETIDRSQRLDYALVSSLERDPLLAERLRRLRTVPGVGPITALTWALEIGDFTRFPSVKEAISYCGLCGDESAVRPTRCCACRFPNSGTSTYPARADRSCQAGAATERNELALIHQKAMEKGNRNRATLAVARKIVAWLLAVDRENREFIPAEQRETQAA
jgi:transposase